MLVRRPEVWVYGVATAAGGLLMIPHHHPDAASVPVGIGHWGLMVVAMMLPVVGADARRVAMRALWRRRQRAMLEFLAGYLAVWVAIGVALVCTQSAVGTPPIPSIAVVAGLLGAAAWQISRPRRRVLRRCGSLGSCAAKGWAATRDGVLSGVRVGRRCAFTCAPLMLAISASHEPFLMVAGFALLVSERRRGPNPRTRAGRPFEAWCLVGCAALVGASSVA